MSDSPTKIKLLARAKLNLSLDITGQRRDGYHLMDMVMRSVDLSDELTLRLAESGGISIASNMRFLPRGEKNLAFRAAQSLCASVGMPLPSLHIDIKKNIPTQAGLGGGSADAAAVLVGLNTLFSLGLSCDELCAVGETIGADVPFCVCGGTARVRGIGELIEPIEDNCSYTVLILMPALGRSTHEAFARWNTDAIFNHPDVSGTVNALRTGD
ncbi:MAG: 4-(cytidine 5'-diphospho)-2-C-methyl-D-erythritol kinase, partial [Oscillospiraceae bacterium]